MPIALIGALPTLLTLSLLAPAADVLVVGLRADPVTLDPHRATDLVSLGIVVNVCETLVQFRGDGSRPEPALATTWATVDGRVWTFTLREGVRFHDGTAFDADAVVANLENLRRARAFPGTAERLGPHVVALTLDQPNAALLATLSQPFFCLQSPRAVGRPGGPVGSGPFRLAAARPGRVELVANPRHWAGPPRLARVLFRRYASDDDLLRAVLAGEVDVTAALGPRHLERLRGRESVRVESQTGMNLAFLSLNNRRHPFDDRRVRLAVARAVDRDALVRDVLGGHGEPARNPLPPALWGYATRTRALMLDRASARRLLAEAGFPDGFDTTLLAVGVPRPYLPDPLRIAERLRDDLALVGVRARLLRVASWAEYVEPGSQGRYDMAVYGWQADTADPNDFLSALLASESRGATNRSGYGSPDMDALLKRGRRDRDPRRRLAAYHEAQDLFQRDMPWVPLYHVSSLTVYGASVRAVQVASTGILRYDQAWKAE